MTDARFDEWVHALEQRHLSTLRVQEVTRALRALSSVYVERRDALQRGAALDSDGKRAAFALFYGPLHYLVAREIVIALGAGGPGIGSVFDLGCGTGAVGAAWASAIVASDSRRSKTPETRASESIKVLGFDRHPWAVAEAGWTYRAFQLDGVARREDVRDVRFKGRPAALVAAFTVNELPDDTRGPLLQRLLKAATAGSRVLVVEPIARPKGRWWDVWSEAFAGQGGREDTWRFDAELPPLVRTLDHAAGLDHRMLTARSLYLTGGSPRVRESERPGVSL